MTTLMRSQTRQLRCPCKDKFPSIETNVFSQVSKEILETMIKKQEEIGDFFFNKTNWIFKDVLFQPNETYTGFFILKSPFRFFIDINSKCNLNCIGCYFGKKGKKEISIENFKYIIDSIVDANVIGIQLLGGEPTLHPHLVEMCKYAKEKGIKIELVTNGYNVPEELIVSLKGLVDLFCVSVDGNEDTHNKLRGKHDSYKKAIATYTLLKKYKFYTRIIMTVNRENYNDISDVVKLVEDKNTFEVKNFVCGECNQNLQITKNISIRIKEILENLGLSLNSLPQGFSQSQNVEFYGCPGGTFSGCIDVAGNVYACLYMRNKENILGNVYSQSILDIWKQNNEYIIQGKKEQCLDCDFLHRCGGKCLVKNK